jgi:hypothetical protein
VQEEGITLFIALVRIKNTTYMRDLRVSYNKSLSFILETYKNSETMVEQRA